MTEFTKIANEVKNTEMMSKYQFDMTQRSPRTHIWNLFYKKVLSTLFVLRTCTFLAGTRTKMYT